MSRHFAARWMLVVAFTLVLAVGAFLFLTCRRSGVRTARLQAWLRDPAAHADWAIQAGVQCPGTPFAFPTGGYVGFLWGDSFRPGHRHQGIDIFGGGEPGLVPVFAAYPGYLSRLPDWKSSLIIRIPNDPLRPGRQIWTYYTHMADPQGNSFISSRFPPGSAEVYVEAGTLLGYQGNYSGDSSNPTGVHLHFSIVLGDGRGRFTNELEFSNTLDPSPYFGMPLNTALEEGVPGCAEPFQTGGT